MATTQAMIEKYRDLLENVFPKGRLWTFKEQPVLRGLLESFAVELCRVDQRVLDALREADPRLTDELLEDWERMLGLPDECSPEVQTPEERRNQVVQKYTNVGGLSEEFYEFVAAQLGFPTTDVFNYVNFIVGRGTVGQPLTNYFDETLEVGETIGQPLAIWGWRYVWGVEMPATSVETLEVGEEIGVGLREFTNPVLECTYKKLKPAHSAVFFTFA